MNSRFGQQAMLGGWTIQQAMAEAGLLSDPVDADYETECVVCGEMFDGRGSHEEECLRNAMEDAPWAA